MYADRNYTPEPTVPEKELSPEQQKEVDENMAFVKAEVARAEAIVA